MTLPGPTMSSCVPRSRIRLWTLLAVIVGLGLPAARAQPTRQWNQGDPTAEEQYALEWLNLARKDPVGTLTYLYGLDTSDAVIEAFVHYLAGQPSNYASWIAGNLQSAQTSYAFYQNLSATSPKTSAISNEPLVLYPAFRERALVYSQNPSIYATVPTAGQFTIPTYFLPITTAEVSGNSPVFSGANATGGSASFGPFGGNYYRIVQARLYNQALTGREWTLSFLNTFSQSAAGFLLAQGDALPTTGLGHTRMAGIALTGSTNQDRLINLFLASNEFLTASDLPFGNTNTVFITGVAYRDSNSNSHYDIGEGISGATIVTDKGAWYAVSSTSGGYSIPVAAGSGTYTLTITGGAFAGATATVTVGASNVKCDWVLPPLPNTLPTQATVPAPTGSTQFTALSTRGLVENGSNSLIGGVVITGAAGVQKKLLFRGVGPSLNKLGITNWIGATSLQIYNAAGTLVAANAGWSNSPDGGQAALEAANSTGDFALYPLSNGAGDSALVVSLAPGAYTAVVSPFFPNSPDATGSIGLLEIYDLTPDLGVLADIATRGHVGTGSQQLIVGCVVAGSGSKRMLVRGSGPELALRFQIPNTLQNPEITLYNSQQQAVSFNDDWSNSVQTNQLRTLAAATGAAPLDEGSVDAALVSTVPPGNWTAIVSAKPGSAFTGVALVELYDAP